MIEVGGCVLRGRPQPVLHVELGDVGDQRGGAAVPRDLLGGPNEWDANPTIRRGIEIREGVIQNSVVVSFQARDNRHTHWLLATWIQRGVERDSTTFYCSRGRSVP